MCYSYFTKKQANIIYSAFKRGNVTLTKKQSKMLYDLIGRNERFSPMSMAERQARHSFEDAVKCILDGKFELAQACIDGGYLVEEFEEVSYVATEADCKNNCFLEIGEIVKERRFIGYRVCVHHDFS